MQDISKVLDNLDAAIAALVKQRIETTIARLKGDSPALQTSPSVATTARPPSTRVRAAKPVSASSDAPSAARSGRAPRATEVSDEAFMEAVRTHSSAESLKAALGCEKVPFVAAVKRLEAAGRIRREGVARATRYFAVD